VAADNTFLRNVGSIHKIYTVPHPRRRHSSDQSYFSKTMNHMKWKKTSETSYKLNNLDRKIHNSVCIPWIQIEPDLPMLFLSYWHQRFWLPGDQSTNVSWGFVAKILHAFRFTEFAPHTSMCPTTHSFIQQLTRPRSWNFASRNRRKFCVDLLGFHQDKANLMLNFPLLRLQWLCNYCLVFRLPPH
jgi:hypothetical protein